MNSWGGPVCRLLTEPAKGEIKTDLPGSQVVSIGMFEEKQKSSLLPISPLSESSGLVSSLAASLPSFLTIALLMA